MAMSLGGGGHGQRAEINVTPMIDVLLVLLIICMVIQPPNSFGLDARVPQPPKDDEPPGPQNAVVITVEKDRKVRLNQEPLELDQLGGRLKTVFAHAVSSQVIFIRAEKGLEFHEIATVIDIAKGAGLDQIALMTR